MSIALTSHPILDMGKTLVIVESPGKCKSIQKYLGDQYVVVACFGHCVDLAKGGKFGIGIDLNNGLKPKYVLQDDKKSHFDNIVNASIGCERILLAGDPDREGEGISKHLKDRLESTGLPIARISFTEITKNAILSAINNPRDIDQNLFNAQQARRILDRIVGFCVSPVLREIYSQNLSAGRVQSVAIRMIVDREREIKSFKPKEYWNVFANLSDQDGNKFCVKYDGHISDKKQADKIINDVSGGEFTVYKVNRSPEKRNPLPPLTTLVMQQIMSKKHGFSAEQTMAAAQACYEAGYTTYIRTDSVRITDEAIESIRDWLRINGHAVPKKPVVHTVKATAADSHEAIRPSNINNLPSTSLLTGDEKTLYDMVWRYAVASQMTSAIFDTLEVIITCGGHNFRTAGKTLSQKGFFEILGLPKDQKLDIPDLQPAQVLSLDKTVPEQNFTKPLARYSEANLIKDLDARQIGRSSTMATILKNIISRNYVIKNGNTYTPTDLGMKITDTLQKHFGFLNFDYSALMEKRLDDIASGAENYDKLMTDFYSLFKTELRDAIVCNNKISCDRCNGIMVERENGRGKYLSCSGCRNFKNVQ